ncbi:MAG: hypothetical protein LAO06_08200 [Acidobacteriia bacterium]|nr:hypothetical protein [Terriglobia bacterium]
MNPGSGRNFDSIESAHDFVALLAQTVIEAKKEIDADVQKEEGSKTPRRLDALRLVSYGLEKLELHMKQSCRILNDLRSLRRLLAAERTAPARAVSAKPAPAVRPDLPIPAVHSPSPARVGASPARSGRVVVA